MSALEVIATGPLTTVQDLGRPGLARLGVGTSGAADRASLRLANRLVANDEGAAGLEVTLGGLVLHAYGDVLLALTGAPCQAAVDGRPVGHNALLPMRSGARLTLGTPRSGLRTYVGVRGGLDVPPVLGSRATDVLSGIGPPVPARGTVLPVGAPPAAFPCVDQAPVADPTAEDLVLRVLLGPRDDWFTPDSLHHLLTVPWTVSADSDRVGMRLSGEPLVRAREGELASEGTVRGALQVPPSGAPTLFLADHPLTGGYPVVAVVVDADVDLAAQSRPGQRLRLRRVLAA